MLLLLLGVGLAEGPRHWTLNPSLYWAETSLCTSCCLQWPSTLGYRDRLFPGWCVIPHSWWGLRNSLKLCQNFLRVALQSEVFSFFPLSLFFFLQEFSLLGGFTAFLASCSLFPHSHSCFPHTHLILASASCRTSLNTVGSFASFSICGWESWGSEWLSYLTEVTQLKGGRTDHQTQFVNFQSACL